MAHLGVFPYSENDSGEGYIFSALNCKCSTEDFTAALNDGTINQSYHDQLVTNMWSGDAPKPAFWSLI